jgi:hypothetical protein
MSQVDQSQTRAAGILLRHNNRLEELQQTLDLHSGRLDRIEGNQRRNPSGSLAVRGPVVDPINHRSREA